MRVRALIVAALVASTLLAASPASADHGWHASFVDLSPWPKLVPGGTPTLP